MCQTAARRQSQETGETVSNVEKKKKRAEVEYNWVQYVQLIIEKEVSGSVSIKCEQILV